MTSDERHEMAERLRALLDDDLDFDDPRSDVSLAEVEVALRLLGGFYDNSTKAKYVQHLADLIDRPTCRIGYVPGSADRSCSACGVTFSTGTYQGGDHEEHEFMFCPNCGAEVVEDAQ